MLSRCSCLELCSEYSYETKAIGSPWPHRSDQLAFYNRFVAPRPEIYGNSFDVYAEIQADVGNVSDAEVLRRVDEAKLIRKNFIRINVPFNSHSSIELEENPSMTVDALTSSIGGAVSLWIGDDNRDRDRRTVVQYGDNFQKVCSVDVCLIRC